MIAKSQQTGYSMFSTVRGLGTALLLGVALTVAAPTPTPVQAQNGKNAGEGFFDIPERETDPNRGAIYGYVVVFLFGGLGLYVIGKTSHREILK